MKFLLKKTFIISSKPINHFMMLTVYKSTNSILELADLEYENLSGSQVFGWSTIKKRDNDIFMVLLCLCLRQYLVFFGSLINFIFIMINTYNASEATNFYWLFLADKKMVTLISLYNLPHPIPNTSPININ